MKILLIEDELGKEQDIIKFLDDLIPDEKVKVRRSITSGIIAIRQETYDYVLLDMSLPLYDHDDMAYAEDNEFEAFGGNFVLDELDRKYSKSRVIVITAFDILGEGSNQIELAQVSATLEQNYPDIFVGTVYYKASTVDWKRQLRELLDKGENNFEDTDS